MSSFYSQKLFGFATLFLLNNILMFAQKPDMRNIKISYQQLPLQPLDKSIVTYNSELSMDVTLENTDLNKLGDRYLKLLGYEKTEDHEDIIIKADFGEFQFNKQLITKDVYNINRGETVKGHYYETVCSYPVSLSLVSKDGSTIFHQTIEHSTKLLNFDFGKWTYSIAELDAKLSTEEEELFTELKNKCDKKALSEIKDVLTSNFSTLGVTKKIKIASGKGEKVNYSDLESAILHMENAFEMISSESASEDVNTELNKAIEIWENALSESSGNKKARINEAITTMLYYNIGIAYWWTTDFANAQIGRAHV